MNWRRVGEFNKVRSPCEKCGSRNLYVPLPHRGVKGVCPHCYIAQIERGELQPLPESARFGAKDLPRTILSDHIEHRLYNKLNQERQARAKQQGQNYDEVPGVEALIVRVVSSVDKKLQVGQPFREMFHNENYPSEFPYKSKAVLLFQNIEGMEVCLFGMYVQEYGSECPFPNQRQVYLSFLDSLEYFQPEVKAVNGEPLSTVVYHEILIGYLEYCKERGFTCCHIWACPPFTGEDHIFNRHVPEIQRRPKSDKLCEWYLAMLRKASKEQIAVETTNLFDHFFVSTGECKAKVTAVRLPYLDGDYWHGAAEDLINQSANASEDHLLMNKLGETISPMKEDFIMVHLQHYCNHCAIPMVSGNRWVCNQCKNFQICDECYEVELMREEIDRHPVNHIDKHTLSPFSIIDVPVDTKDEDEIPQSDYFDDRYKLLRLCQAEHYQCDKLSQAKCFSMMMLHDLHNPIVFVFPICSTCHLRFNEGWQCNETLVNLCNSCYHKDVGVDPPHKLANDWGDACSDAHKTEDRQQRFIKRKRTDDLVIHTSQCRSKRCGFFPHCVPLKRLLRHDVLRCKTQVSGGCRRCMDMWVVLKLHAHACNKSECHVPHCRGLKAHCLTFHRDYNSRRRKDVKNMMMTQAAEAVEGLTLSKL